MKLREALTILIMMSLVAIGLWQMRPASSFEVAKERGKKESNDRGPRGTKASRETRFAGSLLEPAKANQILLML